MSRGFETLFPYLGGDMVKVLIEVGKGNKWSSMHSMEIGAVVVL